MSKIKPNEFLIDNHLEKNNSDDTYLNIHRKFELLIEDNDLPKLSFSDKKKSPNIFFYCII